MKTDDDSCALVFYLLDDEPGVSETPTTFFAAEMPELSIDEQTPRFVCQHLTANALGVAEPLMLKVCQRDPFIEHHLARVEQFAEGQLAAELRLLRQWMARATEPNIAYQWKLGAAGLEPWRRPDDLVTYWEELPDDKKANMLRSASDPFLVDWFVSGRALAMDLEERVFSELLAANSDNLPFYEYVFRSLLTGQRGMDGNTEMLKYRVCDRAVKMFIRFPTYLSRRFLRRDRDHEGELRGIYLDLLATAFRFNVAPLSLERFCDYLSAKADCHGQERADLAWFVGELSIFGRPGTQLGAQQQHRAWFSTDTLGVL